MYEERWILYRPQRTSISVRWINHLRRMASAVRWWAWHRCIDCDRLDRFCGHDTGDHDDCLPLF